ncbi:DUF2510 domain-containing protein [Clavibacter capsici]|uniref:DUF2510 domain-containing protein n=1 Tax=Clavibacter capsici TaxID=1874630 RepID=UPI0014281BDD|nr:DUF2510 domain-containing protein [Clavibacter capsici]QIS41057.1 DUF2510 domain-containing protein [Clavibacter capsici]
MTDSTGTPSTPAGWYADPAGSDRLRWWDGTRWTDHLTDAPTATAAAPAPAATPDRPHVPPVAPPAYGQQAHGEQAQQPAYGQPAQQPYSQQTYPGAPYSAPTPPPQVPAGTSPFTWGIWVVAALPAISLLAAASYDFRDYMRASMSGRVDVDGGYVLMQLLGFLVYAATVVVAYFDWRDVGRRGIVRPFHWAWSFLGGGVYVIGRSIIVRRRITGSPASALTPIWVWAAINVVALFVVTIKLVAAVSAVLPMYGPGRY